MLTHVARRKKMLWMRRDRAPMAAPRQCGAVHDDSRDTLVERVVLSLSRLASRKMCKLDTDTRRFKPLAILRNICVI
jgi:hypothetical protein